MKIETTCSGAAPSITSHDQIPLGTVYRFGEHNYGPYLRVADGLVDLRLSRYYPLSVYPSLSNYLALPDARLVLTKG